MSVKAIRDRFLSAYRAPINGETYYIKGKDVFKKEIINKGMIINDTFYRYSDLVRNSMYLLKTIRSSFDNFLDEGSKVLQFVCDAKDDDTLVVSQMYETICSGLWTLYSDYVKYFAKMPITDESMDSVATLASSYVVNTYNTLLEFKNAYDSGVSDSYYEAQRRYNSYNSMTQARIDAAPKTGVFFGDSYQDIFGTQHVFGSAHIFSSVTPGEIYMETAQNKVMAENEKTHELVRMKDRALDQINAFVSKTLKSFRKDIFDVIEADIHYLFNTDALFYTGIENRPFVIANWKDVIEDIPEADYAKLKHYFEFYQMSVYEGIVTPIYDKIIEELSENGDFDSYSGNLRKMYEFFTGSDSFLNDRSFQFRLTDYICDKIDKQYDALNLDNEPYTDRIFADIDEKAKQNKYLPYDCSSTIHSHIFSKRNKIKEKRGY